MRSALLLLAITATAQAQWDLQTSNTTASLRGIHALGNGIAWASGTEGTVLHTTDDGAHWQRCTTPPDAEKLDFRGIQAFDANTAIVMSSGKGDLSRLYKTTDGCKTWKLVFLNPDKDGFWDALKSVNAEDTYLLGDPVSGQFKLFCELDDDPKYSECWNGHPIFASRQESAFAASNSVIFVQNGFVLFGTGGVDGAAIHMMTETSICVDCSLRDLNIVRNKTRWTTASVPVGNKTESSGIFSIGARRQHPGGPIADDIFVVVGGDYVKPNDSTRTAAFTTDGGKTWQPSTTPPHGYRSAVAYYAATKTWITVGPNGTDISTDDGRNWRALHPLPTQAPDADQHWNALSLPFVVGPHGRIGILNRDALKPVARP